jgi:sugar phosphate isomerase/epimerase
VRIGIDGLKLPEARKRGPLGSLDLVADLGLEGIFFSSVLDMSPTLDPRELAEIRDHADTLGLYLESGLGKINPFCSAEAPELRAAGQGDIILGFTRMIERCAEIGCVELWVSTGNFKPAFPGRLAVDRFRTDVTWEEQLRACERVLHLLAPVARANGVHLNIETHDEITSFEILRLIEAVGADCVGCVFDTANVLQRGEHPVWAAQRLAPLVRQTHIKDAYMARAPGGLDFQPRACGEGLVDFAAILPILRDQSPARTLSLEICQSTEDKPRAAHPRQCIQIDDPLWRAGHPDLTNEEREAYLDLIDQFEGRINAGEIETWESFEARNYGYPTYKIQDYGYSEALEFIQRSCRHLREIVTDSQA